MKTDRTPRHIMLDEHSHVENMLLFNNAREKTRTGGLT